MLCSRDHESNNWYNSVYSKKFEIANKIDTPYCLQFYATAQCKTLCKEQI
jgi:hypothetical protein